MNGYTTITIAGKTVGLKFGMYLNEMLGQEQLKRPLFSGEHMNQFGIANLLFYAYENNCIAKKIDPDPELTFEVFYDFTETGIEDKKVSSALTDVVKEWLSSKPMERLIKEVSIVEKKRTSPIKKSGKR